MKKFLNAAAIAAVASIVSFGSANAVTTSFAGGQTNPGTEPVIRNFNAGDVDDPFANVASISFLNAYIHPQAPNDPGGALNPFVAPPSPYLTITAGGYVDVSFIKGLNEFSFDWGSRDTYNKLTIFTTSGSTVVVPAPGSGNQGAADHNGYFRVKTAPGEEITRLLFETGQNSFEIDNFAGSVVPEPATWAMMITGFGLAGVAIRRRRSVFAAA